MYAELPATEFRREPGAPEVFDATDLVDRCLGNASLAQRIVAKFRLQLQTEIPLLEQDWQRSDLTALGALAHRLKGSAAAAGAPALMQSLDAVERMARSGEAASLSDGLKLVVCNWQRFEDELARCPLGERLG